MNRDRGRATELMRAAGSVDLERDVRYLANQVEAMTLHQLAYPDPDFDPGRSHRAGDRGGAN